MIIVKQDALQHKPVGVAPMLEADPPRWDSTTKQNEYVCNQPHFIAVTFISIR